MGTSTAYTPSPNWSSIKTTVTNALNAGGISGSEAHDLISQFVQELCDQEEDGFGVLPSDFGHIDPQEALEKLEHLLKGFPPLTDTPARPVSRPSGGGGGGGGAGDGGAERGSRGEGGSSASRGGGAGGSRSVINGSGSVRPAAQKLARFISEVPRIGLKQALLDAGLSNVEEMAPDQVAMAIADILCKDANLIVETELREALITVVESICDAPETLEAAETALSQSATDLQQIVQKLFECYIMERFKTFFCEHEAAKHGFEATDRILKDAREFVSDKMKLERLEHRDLTTVDWTGPEGAKIVDGILERTIAVYTD